MPANRELKRVLALFQQRISRAPLASKLGHLREALKRLTAERYQFHYGKLEENKESAHFDSVNREIVMDTGLRDQQPDFQAAILAHEIQHAYDHFRRRPYSLESEARAFKAEAIYLSALDVNVLAAAARDFYGYMWFDYLFEGRIAYLEGPDAFDEFVNGYFVKSRLGHSFEGLETIPKLLEDASGALRHKEARLKRQKNRSGWAQPEIARILKAQIRMLGDLQNTLRREDRHNKTHHLPLVAANQ
ncbi:MAG: hypothetical protein HYT79_09640 [Elusimicrobia bacterium]|nr:hypothetical protein [Elusimicrobiota bacterium]